MTVHPALLALIGLILTTWALEDLRSGRTTLYAGLRRFPAERRAQPVRFWLSVLLKGGAGTLTLLAGLTGLFN